MQAIGDNTLAYIDQASFLARRALGRGPVIQYVWIYDRPVDLDGIRSFHRNLRYTLLGRMIERSPLPFGRHRWVSYGGPADLDIAVSERHRDQVWDWVDERSFVPIDPELGPPWHLGVQPLIGGGAAVCLAVSHTIADAVAGIDSIVAAVAGVRGECDFPPPGARSRRRALRDDAAVSIRSARDIPAAIAAATRMAREQQDDLSTSAKAAGSARANRRGGPVVVPRVYGAIDGAHWEERARELGATRNVLFAGLATRIGYRLGRSDDNGRILLSIPVSERTANDIRANPLNAITVHADPGVVCGDLVPLRAQMKHALVDLADHRDTILAPLAMTPFVPQILVRRLENLVLKVGKPVGCSNIGDISASANRPDGTDADFFGVRGGEAGVTAAELNRLGGHLLVSAASMRGRVWFSVASWESGRTNTRAELRATVQAALADLELSGDLE